MFDSEYKTMMEKIAPGQELIAETALKMQTLNSKNRKSPRMRRGFAVLAALVVIGVIGASAVTLSQRKVVEWNGNLLDVRLQDPEQKQKPGGDVPHGVFTGAPEDELWVLKNNQWGAYDPPAKTIPTLEGITQAIKSTASEFQLPSFIPDGYEYTQGHLTFYASSLTRDTAKIIISEESPKNGVTLKKYKLPDTVWNNLEGYDVSFKDSAGHVLYIRCKRMDANAKTTFSLEEDAITETVEISGSQQGLYLEEEVPVFKSLHLRKNMTPVQYVGWANLDDSQILPNTFDNAVYHISSDFLTKGQLIQIAQGLK